MLARELIRKGYEVIGLDTGVYKERTFYRDGGTTPLTLAKDLRHVGMEDLRLALHFRELRPTVPVETEEETVESRWAYPLCCRVPDPSPERR